MDGVSSVDEDEENDDGASRLSDLPEVGILDHNKITIRGGSYWEKLCKVT
jgi:hypothetical protein